jgi:hypothetical protein
MEGKEDITMTRIRIMILGLTMTAAPPTCRAPGTRAMGLPHMPSTMRLSRLRLAITTALVSLVALASCSKPPLPGDLKISDITIGRMLAPDGTITDESKTNLFWTTDTFYVSVKTEGSAQNVALQARWMGPGGTVAAESTRTISPSGPTITAFEAPPKDGRWPEGDYKVDILVNGTSQGTRDLNAR